MTPEQYSRFNNGYARLKKTNARFLWLFTYEKLYRRTPGVIKPLAYYALQLGITAELCAILYRVAPSKELIGVIFLAAFVHFGEKTLDVIGRSR